MNTVKIANILEGRNLPEAGMALYPFIEEAINSNQTLCIDMEGVDWEPVYNPAGYDINKEVSRRL